MGCCSAKTVTATPEEIKPPIVEAESIPEPAKPIIDKEDIIDDEDEEKEIKKAEKEESAEESMECKYLMKVISIFGMSIYSYS